jgi:ubiquitin-protein ligase
MLNKRLLKEIKRLYLQQSQKQLVDNDYIIEYNESDTSLLHAIIKAPYDSVYRHKFIRLDFKIPENYPHSPPEVTFINYDGVRIHPNMYESGKCCATILNTWGDSIFEKWTSSMGIETILLTFHSFLDNNPYMYEPGGGDDPSYTVYVQYQSWISCLTRYLQNEKIDLFNQYIHNYLLINIDNIFTDLQLLETLYPYGYYSCRCFEIDNYVINYDRIIKMLENYYNYINFTESIDVVQNELVSFEEFVNTEYTCYICFDTLQLPTNVVEDIKLICGHQFHKDCLKLHSEINNKICPMCRRELQEEDLNKLNNQDHNKEEWIKNPLTKRRVKIGSRTYKYLKENNII